MKAREFINGLAIVVILFVLCGLLLPARSPGRRSAIPRIAQCKMEMAGIPAAIEQYKLAYGAYPHGEPAFVLQKLLGDNPNTIVFLNISPKSTNSAGGYVYPWGTPYDFMFDSTDLVTIRSAGKNKIFGDKDDVTTSIPETDR